MDEDDAPTDDFFAFFINGVNNPTGDLVLVVVVANFEDDSLNTSNRKYSPNSAPPAARHNSSSAATCPRARAPKYPLAGAPLDRCHARTAFAVIESYTPLALNPSSRCTNATSVPPSPNAMSRTSVALIGAVQSCVLACARIAPLKSKGATTTSMGDDASASLTARDVGRPRVGARRARERRRAAVRAHGAVPCDAGDADAIASTSRGAQ